MTKRPRKDLSDPKVVERLRRQGKGSKHSGPDFESIFEARNIASRGYTHRIPSCWRASKRLVQFFSDLEANFFFTIEWDPTVIDYKEQFDLDIDETQALAESLNLPHPKVNGKPWLMSTDLLVTRLINGTERLTAYSVKPFKEVEILNSPNPIHVRNNWKKLKIEIEYWKRRGVPWKLVTERNFSAVLSKNVQHVHPFYFERAIGVSPQVIDQVEKFVRSRSLSKGDALSRIAEDCDKHLQLEVGKCLKVVLHLIARRRLLVDFTAPFNPNKPAKLLNATL